MDSVACSLIIPVLAPYLRSLGASHFTIGSLVSLYFGLQLISSPVISYYGDVKSRAFILQITLLVCSTFYCILGTANVLPVIFLSRIVLGMFTHTQILCETILAEVVSPAEKLEIQRTLTFFGTVGIVTGPAIAGNMLELHHGFQYVCCIISIIFLINFAIVNLFLPNGPHTNKNEKDNKAVKSKTSSPDIKDEKHVESETSVKKTIENEIKRESLLKEIFNSVTGLVHINWLFYWDVFLLKFLFDFTHTIHLVNFAPVLRDVYSTPPRWIGYTVALQGLAIAISGFLTEWMNMFYKSDPNHTNRSLHGFGLLTFSFFCLSLAPNWTCVFVCLLPLSTSVCLLKTATLEIIKQRISLNKKGSVKGPGQYAFSAARLFAPVCTGLVYDMYGFQGTSLLKVVVAGIATALSYSLLLQQVQDKKKM
ncbi:Major facilitator superfamily domain-containing protein 9 [Zootermopsis nevadensis]|uniref:Major facilitator superfamily domain-containing protein 9 n=2 Tax=Zootermopsis nevadensis TaxID=136037 RepID=A0A067RK56_ZOONE|nr:Major facilitator superfamily domain-containing protein 9 [Zootermopsis nevadensis]